MDTCTACNHPIADPTQICFYAGGRELVICRDCQHNALSIFLSAASSDELSMALQTAGHHTEEARNPMPEPPDFPEPHRAFDPEALADLDRRF